MILRGFESASTGMQALIEMHDNIANNISNVNTVGYKKANLTFKNVYDANVVSTTGLGQASDARELGSLSMGSTVQKLTYDFEQGSFNQTDNPFDLTIQGDGFFKIMDKDGKVSYTRNGSFTLNNLSQLVTKDGDNVLDVRNRPVTIQMNDIEMHSYKDILVNENGQIQINNGTNQQFQQTIQISDFSNKEDMFCIGGSKFVPRVPETNPELKAEKFTIVQGGLEMSNANIINEMINTINTSRNYESLSKIVKTSGDTLSRAIQLGRIKGQI